MSTTVDDRIQHGPHRLLCCVPQEPYSGIPENRIALYSAFILGRPPLPADIEAALKAAIQVEFDVKKGVRISPTFSQLARALLKCNGRGE